MVTPDRGHPVAQQLVLGSFAVVSIAGLMLVAVPPAWVTLPGWAWGALVELILVLGTIYGCVWQPWRRERDSNPRTRLPGSPH